MSELVKIPTRIISASIGPAYRSSLGVDGKYRQKLRLARGVPRRSPGSLMCEQHDQSAASRCFTLPELVKIPTRITSASMGRAYRSSLGVDGKYRQKLYLARSPATTPAVQLQLLAGSTSAVLMRAQLAANHGYCRPALFSVAPRSLGRAAPPDVTPFRPRHTRAPATLGQHRPLLGLYWACFGPVYHRRNTGEHTGTSQAHHRPTHRHRGWCSGLFETGEVACARAACGPPLMRPLPCVNY